jgi:hypothetical protein
MMNLIPKANNGGKKSRTILIEMKLEPTAMDKVIIVIHSANCFISLSTVAGPIGDPLIRLQFNRASGSFLKGCSLNQSCA